MQTSRQAMFSTPPRLWMNCCTQDEGNLAFRVSIGIRDIPNLLSSPFARSSRWLMAILYRPPYQNSSQPIT